MPIGLRAKSVLFAALAASMSSPSSAQSAASVTQPQAAREPRAIVAEIYRISAGAEGKYRGPSAFRSKRVRALYFSRTLLAAVIAAEKKEAANGEAILDFDPVTDSQDPEVANLSITTESTAPGKATVLAAFRHHSGKYPSLVRYDFIREGDRWALDEIRGENRNNKEFPLWSLREILQGS